MFLHTPWVRLSFRGSFEMTVRREIPKHRTPQDSHRSTATLTGDAFRRRRLLTPAGDPNFPVDDDGGNAR